MELNLLSGRYTATEAEKLLKSLLKVKTDFHLAKIDALEQNEEDIKHSERRIKELEEHQRKIVALIKNGNFKHVALNAKLSIEFFPDYQSV